MLVVKWKRRRMIDSVGDTIHVAGEPRIITRRFKVTLPVAETDAQARARRKLGLPEPSFGYTVLTVAQINAEKHESY